MSFGSEMIGKELTIINTYDEREMFYPEVPDTIWIKKVKKPKLDKHYTLSYIYKATQDAKWETPSQYVDGRTFLIKNIVYNEKEPGVGKSENRYYVYTLSLEDVSTGENIQMKIDRNDEHYVLKFRVRNLDILNQLKGKSFVESKTGKHVVVKDCYYEYKSYSSGWSLRYSSAPNLEIEFEDGTSTFAKYATTYLPPAEYEKQKREEELKALKRDAERGQWKIVYKNATKPQSSKFTTGKITYNDYLNLITYVDNHITLMLTAEEENFSFELKNTSSSTLTIDWDEIIFVNAESESQRVVHSGIKYRDKNNPQQPSLVAKNSVLKDILIPTDRIKWMTDEWWVGPILNWRSTPGYYNGKQVQLIFPIKINGVSYEYTFVFDLVWKWTYPEAREKWLQMQSK
jgi:hypothetical protein